MGKTSSFSVSKIIKMSIFTLTCSARNSNLFLIYSKMQKLAYLCYRCVYFSSSYRSHYIFWQSVLLTVHSPGAAFRLSLSDCQSKTLDISPIKLFANIFEPFLFKLSLPLLRCRGLIHLEFSIR